MLDECSTRCPVGGLASGGHPNDFNDTNARNHQKSPNDDYARRRTQMGAPDKGRQRVRQGMVHVPGEHRSNAESNWLPERSW